MRLQGAIFDMDGTLLDSMGMWRQLGPSLLLRHGVQPTEAIRQQLKPLSLREGVALCRETCGLPGTVDDLVGEVWDDVQDFYARRVRPKPGVERLLSLLRMEGVSMYVATATDRPLTEAGLRSTGLEGFFRGVVTCQEAGQGKEEGPAVYERALRRLRTRKEDTVVFEDALHAARTAKEAGFRVAAVYDPWAEEDQAELRTLADHYFRSFEELLEAGPLS